LLRWRSGPASAREKPSWRGRPVRRDPYRSRLSIGCRKACRIRCSRGPVFLALAMQHRSVPLAIRHTPQTPRLNGVHASFRSTAETAATRDRHCMFFICSRVNSLAIGNFERAQSFRGQVCWDWGSGDGRGIGILFADCFAVLSRYVVSGQSSALNTCRIRVTPVMS
jgi:hypothetical protein